MKRKHGTGTVMQRGPTRWAIRWRIGGKRQYMTGFPNRREAMVALRRLCRVEQERALAEDLRAYNGPNGTAAQCPKCPHRNGDHNPYTGCGHLTPAYDLKGYLVRHDRCECRHGAVVDRWGQAEKG